MKHYFEGLYQIPHKAKTAHTYTYCTKAYVEANKIELGNPRHGFECEKAYPLNSMTGKGFNLHDVDGVSRKYMYGEKTYFDTEEELAEYRENIKKEVKDMFKVYNDTEFTTQFLKGLEWEEVEKIEIDGKTATKYVAKMGGKIFRKSVWSDKVIVFSV